MHGLTTALLGAALGALGLFAEPSAAPDVEAEIRACQAKCGTIDDETDRATCKLNCEEATDVKDRAHVIRWTEERSVGGPVPGETTTPPPVTTVTTVTPRGTTTTTTAPAAPPPAATPPAATRQSPRERYYFGLVGCQDRCAPIGVDLDRARCKLQCLRRQPGPPPPRTRPYVRKAPRVAAPRPTNDALAEPTPPPSHSAVDCRARCAHEAVEDDRLTCEAQCEYAQPRGTTPTVRPNAATTTGTTRPPECRQRCSDREASCRTACDGDGSDASTCRIQCEETANACVRRCG